MALFSFSNPQSILAAVFVLSGAFVNGWTDAPVAITALVATKTMPIKKAALLAGVFNMLGAIAFIFINQNVALTVFNIANLGGSSLLLSLLISSLAAVNIWSVAAWFFGLPTSESHGVLAALSGASFFLFKNFSGINFYGWLNVLAGMLISIAIGFLLSFLFTKIFLKTKNFLPKNIKRLKIVSSAFLAFMHGAQDSQKFAGLFMLVLFSNKYSANSITVPVWCAGLIGFIISIGTAIAGTRIINKTGTKMVELSDVSGLCSNLASAFAMFFSSLLGLSVSTTHCSSASLIGATVSAKKRVSIKDTLQLVFAWALTFPACFFISYLICAITLST
ncbi:MAG: inorganic phosphate transporter [Clostridia bacterium]|nr:inorganic phosphate transporter [Clostridia bacterium]